MTFASSLNLIIIVIFGILSSSASSLAPPSPSSSSSSSPSSSSSKRLFFQAKSSSNLIIEDKGSLSLSLLSWLDDHPASNPYILGSQNVNQISKDTFNCIQPSISWFGIELVPIFVSQISRESTPIIGSSSNSKNDGKSIISIDDINNNNNNNNDNDNNRHDHEYLIQVDVLKSQTDLGRTKKDQKGKTIQLVQNLMEKCQFSGVNRITCRRRLYNNQLNQQDDTSKSTSNNNTINRHGSSNRNNNRNRNSNSNHNSNTRIWEITSELSLQLTVPLPKSRFFILPPGFNSIGSRIVRSTCDKRSKETLEEFKNEYLDWSRSGRDED